jgi:hypothetical protein
MPPPASPTKEAIMSPHNVQRQRIGRGILLRLTGHGDVGLLEILDEATGTPHVVVCNHRAACKTLSELFPDFLPAGHLIAGPRIYWGEDQDGVLVGLSPEEDTPPVVVAVYEGLAAIHGADITPL